MTRRHILLLCVVGFAVAGCTVGPDYKRPEVSVPPVYRAADTIPPVASAASFGDLAWWNVFQDPELQELIRTALVENYDLRVAVSRILQAQSQVTVARSLQYPTADVGVTAPYDAVVGGERPPTTPRDSVRAPGRTRRRVGAGPVGEIPPEHRVGLGQPARHRGGPVRRHDDPGRPGRPGLPDVSGPWTSRWKSPSVP